MIASVKSIDLIDYENWAFFPDDAKNFCVAAETLIGFGNGDGADIFSFEICTPNWFIENRLYTPTFCRGIIFVTEFDEVAIKQSILKLVHRSDGSSWEEITAKLCRYLRWEFEDYQSN